MIREEREKGTAGDGEAARFNKLVSWRRRKEKKKDEGKGEKIMDRKQREKKGKE